jgi:ubiquinone/menaquinone biosynthesis C-methylase UbiE
MTRELKKITAEDIKNMDYNQLIGILRETNRPPGGINSIIDVINSIKINEKTKILEIGTSTGFTAFEFARLTKCHVIAVDINEISLKEAKRRKKLLGLNNICFKLGDVEKLNFPDSFFDIVFCGNIFSLVNKEKAILECVRVLKNNGFIIVIPMYYIKTPPKSIIIKVSKAIKTNIKAYKKRHWIKFLNNYNSQLEFFRVMDYVFNKISDKEINTFTSEMLSSPHLKNLPKKTQNVLNKVYKQYIRLFRDNLSYMGYSIIILRKAKVKFDRELFTGRRI